jgi:DNA-binding XRE family transcriptional regulator
MSRLRNRVKSARVASGLSQRALAERASVSRQIIVLIERDDGYEPTTAVTGRLSDALGDMGLFWRESTYDVRDDADTEQGS